MQKGVVIRNFLIFQHYSVREIQEVETGRTFITQIQHHISVHERRYPLPIILDDVQANVLSTYYEILQQIIIITIYISIIVRWNWGCYITTDQCHYWSVVPLLSDEVEDQVLSIGQFWIQTSSVPSCFWPWWAFIFLHVSKLNFHSKKHGLMLYILTREDRWLHDNYVRYQCTWDLSNLV